MKLVSRFAFLALLLGMASPTMAGDWSSNAQYGSTTFNGFILYNNVWGAGAGPQSIWASWGSNWQYWGVWCDHNGGGIKSYPNITKRVNKKINSINYQGAWYSVRRPSGGAYTSTFDIWFNNDSIELMLWMTKSGNIGPIGSFKTNATVGGHSWKVYRGSNGYADVISYVRDGSTNSANVDLKQIYNDIQDRGWFNNPDLGKVQFGFEITNSPGGMVFENAGFAFWQG